MKHKFSNYAHDSYDDSETLELLIEEYEWNSRDAEQYVCNHRPLYEVKADFEYDTETDKLTVLAAYIEGVKLVPEPTLSLKLWESFDHDALANWEKIDLHDQSSGRGRLITDE